MVEAMASIVSIGAAHKLDIALALHEQLGNEPKWWCHAPTSHLVLAQWNAADVRLVHPCSDTYTLVYHLGGSTRVAGFSGSRCLGQGVRQPSITLDGLDSSRWELAGESSFVHLYIPRNALARYVARVTGTNSVPWLQACFARDDPWLSSFFSLLIQNHMLNSEDRQGALLDSLADALFSHLLRFYTHKAPSSLPARRPARLGNTLLRKIEAFVDEHLGEAVVLQDLAALAGVSEGHLTRGFREATGLTPHQFVIWRRLDRAQGLLGDLDLTLQQVAQRVGFASASHLGEAFRRRFGVTPGQYRAMHSMSGIG